MVQVPHKCELYVCTDIHHAHIHEHEIPRVKALALVNQILSYDSGTYDKTNRSISVYVLCGALKRRLLI